MKIIYQIIGTLSLGVGILGAFLPLLPTTCFVLLAAWCFSKSSPHWHHALKNNRFVGTSITHWEEHRTIPARAQKLAIISMLLSGLYSTLVFDSLTIKLSILFFISLGVWWINHIPTSKRHSASEH